MKAFSPAGMAVKAFYGHGARTFGNPDGAQSGGGAYADGGASPNGPNQGGGSGGGGGQFSGVLLLTAGPFGFGDGVLTGGPDPNPEGAIDPAALSGFAVGYIYFTQSEHFGTFALGMYGAHQQSDFTALQFLGEGGDYTFGSADASFGPTLDGLGAAWQWLGPSVAYFAEDTEYQINVT